MRLASEEPDLGPWRTVALTEVSAALVGSGEAGRPVVVAVDGRSGAGKTTVADALAAGAGPGRGAVVHTDDVAWNQSVLDWDGLLADHVLRPVRAGGAVSWRPPAWVAHDRQGQIEVAAGLSLLVVEGVGAGRAALAPLIDAVVWVQSDLEVSRERGLARDRELHGRSEAEALHQWDGWMAEELPHLAADRPWGRADLVVAGTGVGARPAPGDVTVATRSPFLRRRARARLREQLAGPSLVDELLAERRRAARVEDER